MKIGDKFTRLEVIDILPVDKYLKSRGRPILCKCKCGNLKSTYASYLTGQTCKSCGCLDIESHTTGYENITGSFFCDIQTSAKSRNLEFNITIKDINRLLIQQNFKCAVSGLPIKIARRRAKKETTASLDRIDSSKGYIISNIQFVHKHINIMKNNHTMKYFLILCKTITEFNQLRSEI